MGSGKLVSSSDPDKCGSASVFFLVSFVMKKRNGFALHLMVWVFWSSVKSINAQLVFKGTGQLVFS